MLKNKKIVLASALALAFSAGQAGAAVSAGEAGKLGSSLTLMGAEKAGNGGAIPAFKGSMKPPAGYKNGEKHVDPFAGEKPLFTITAANLSKYQKNLTPGQIAMFKKYPDTFKMPVYKTHRTASWPSSVLNKNKDNAMKTKLIEGGNGLENYVEGAPFPIPKNGLEAVWNHIVRYRGTSVKRTVNQVSPTPNGDYGLVKFVDEFTFFNALKDYDPNSARGNILFYFKQQVQSPPRLAGNVLLVHETLNQVKEPRKAWIYNAGQRRVRRAPQVAYDGPGTAADGQRTSDNFDMYNGAPDRYNWTLKGKKEIYIPYNSYKLNSGDLKYDDIVKAGHLNPDHTRYELHRVWEVEATLKDGQRHIYGKRVMFLDEDTWQASIIDHYDGRGNMWRVAEAHNLYFYDVEVPWYAVETLYDLQSGRYLAFGLDNEENSTYEFGFTRSAKDYSTNALRRSGRR